MCICCYKRQMIIFSFRLVWFLLTMQIDFVASNDSVAATRLLIKNGGIFVVSSNTCLYMCVVFQINLHTYIWICTLWFLHILLYYIYIYIFILCMYVCIKNTVLWLAMRDIQIYRKRLGELGTAFNW